MLATGGLNPPGLTGPNIAYYSGSLYVYCGQATSSANLSILYFNDTYQLNMTTMNWTILDLNPKYESRYYTGSAVIGSKLILLYGWSDQIQADREDVLSLDLISPKGWNQINLKDSCVDVDSFAVASVNGAIYIFGGYLQTTSQYVNNMSSINPLGECKLFSENNVSPSARMRHSLVAINGQLYLYGGYGFNGDLADMWIFSESSGWSSTSIQGTSPGARSGHAYGSQGDVMVIWGGAYNGNFLNDMYMYSAFGNSWVMINATGTIPSARAGACLAYYLEKVFIFGGLTITGLSNELWVYDTALDTYTLLFSNTVSLSINNPPASSFSVCTIANGNFIAMFGTGMSDLPYESVYSFNLTTHVWNALIYSLEANVSRSISVVQYINGYVVVIGGEEWAIDPYRDIIVIDTIEGTSAITSQLPIYYYGGAFAVLQNKIYIHGGGTVIGNTLTTSIPSSSFFSVELYKLGSSVPVVCGPGSYGAGITCEFCPPGSYAASFGQTSCNLCPKGTYNSKTGASSDRQCYPCPENYYSNAEGATFCYQCPANKYCPIGSLTYLNSRITASSFNVQPLDYKTTTDTSSLAQIVYITIGIMFFFVLICYKINFTFRNLLINIDQFTHNHNYKLDNPMYLIKNIWGGIFFIIFLLIAVLLICLASFQYEYENIIESKVLMPLVILETIESRITANINIELRLFSYGDICTEECSTSGVISIEFLNINYDSATITCVKMDGDCYISVYCIDCQILSGGQILYVLEEKSSYCSAISLNITSNSSIPSSLSSIQEFILPAANTIFRGFQPTKFNIMMTPSLFNSFVSGWPEQLTGYHVFVDSVAVPGSEFLVEE